MTGPAPYVRRDARVTAERFLPGPGQAANLPPGVQARATAGGVEYWLRVGRVGEVNLRVEPGWWIVTHARAGGCWRLAMADAAFRETYEPVGDVT